MEKLHIQPSELDMLPYYEYEYIISIYNDMLEERKNNEEDTMDKEMDKYGFNDIKGQMSSMSKGFKNPSSSMKMPKF